MAAGAAGAVVDVVDVARDRTLKREVGRNGMLFRGSTGHSENLKFTKMVLTVL